MTVEKGNNVKVHYRGTLVENGEEFDSSYLRNQTLNFKVGSGQMIKGFDEALLGMTVGQVKEVEISATEAYGERNNDAIQDVPKTQFPEDFEAQVGMTIQGMNEQGQPIMATIVEEKEDSITVDTNHPLAGKDLKFSIELVEVEA